MRTQEECSQLLERAIAESRVATSKYAAGIVDTLLWLNGACEIDPACGGKKPKGQPKTFVEYSEGFERFWAEYPAPNRSGKGKAWESWRRQNLEPLADRIVASVAVYKTTKKCKSGYVLLPATYLNQRRFDDHPEGAAIEQGVFCGDGDVIDF